MFIYIQIQVKLDDIGDRHQIGVIDQLGEYIG